MSRAEALRQMKPEIFADVKLLSTEDGGRKGPAFLGWGCPLMTSKRKPLLGWDAWPLIENEALLPGECRRLGFVFSNKDGIEVIRTAGRFFLWEGRFIGEAKVVD